MIALCTLLDETKQRCLETLVPRWNELDLDGEPAVCYAAANDASPELQRWFRSRLRWEVIFVTTPLADLDVPAAAKLGRETYVHTVHLRKMARLREAVRVTAAGLHPAADRGAEWLFWLDADIDPGRDAFRQLREVLTSTTGALRPRVASGLYCDRYEGRSIVQEWGGYHLVTLRPDRVQAIGFTGFGCVLMTRPTAEALSWAGYDDVATARERSQAERGIPPRGIGEDVYWFRTCQNLCGVPLYLDTRVLCGHLRDDTSEWRYVPVDGRLEPRHLPVPAEAGPAA